MASNGDIRRLVLNDERMKTLTLMFDHTLNIPQLQYALSLNATVKEIVVYTDDAFLPRFPLPEIRGLFETLGSIPTLETLCFNSRSGFVGVVSIQSLIFVLSRATRLVSFAISDLRLEGTDQDWSQFAEELQRAMYLRSFCIIECELSRPPAGGGADALAAIVAPTSSGSFSLDPVVMVLSILPVIEKIYLHSTRSGGLGAISSQAMGALLLSASLKVLKIRDFVLGPDSVKAMARMLQVNPVLKDLKCGTVSDLHVASAVAFAAMLESNSTLECLEMALPTMIDDECASILAKALKVNKGLKSFVLTAEDTNPHRRLSRPVSRPCKEAFEDMLRSNYVMENFILFQRFPVMPEFKLFVTLNRLGRGRLLQNEVTDMEQWVQALATVNDDLNALFYYVSINPDLCNFALEKMKEEQAEYSDPNERPRKKQKVLEKTNEYLASQTALAAAFGKGIA